MLGVMRDPQEDPVRRDRMAIAAAPYLHARAEQRPSKKDAAAQRASSVGGRYATPAAPKLVIDNS